MTPNVQAYFDWERRLLELLEQNQGTDSPEEDDLLDEADVLWWKLSEAEKAHLRTNKGPHFEAICEWRAKAGA